MKVKDLKKAIKEADANRDKEDKSRIIIDLTESLNKVISVVAKDVDEAKDLAFDLISNEPDNIRGFSLEDV